MTGKLGFPAVTDPRGAPKDILVAVQNIRARLETIESQMSVNTQIQASLTALQTAVAALQSASTSSTSSASTSTTFTAQVAIVAGQVVYEVGSGVVAVADATVLAKSYSVIGVATSSAPAGGSLTVATSGDVATTGSGWSYPAPVFLGTAGALTQSPPSGYPAVQVGVAISATQILVLPDQQLTSVEVAGALLGNTRQIDFIAGAAYEGLAINLTGYADAANDRVVIVIGLGSAGSGGTYSI